ncbi:hypothetical protein [Lentzea sp. NEAU-D7]|uniref:hypothetical protein n=1 Tax=Lentzea sp. NEAU-D7 TaxID=2994667 RepID=UPI00224B2DE6|nr:hypothetical protein [Lentzea sp. NEAU-D7]MCX2948783.1 hypothetical protein [Lentzea sp. NEAU-D7]MCX2951341.1 hypothetical protein [Lentzea sp. NEAU-D7]
MSERSERTLALLELLARFAADPALTPQALHDQVLALDPDEEAVLRGSCRARFEPVAPLVRAARWFLSRSTDDRVRLLGLRLLEGEAELGDVPDVIAAATNPGLARVAVQVLVKIEGAEHDAIRFAEEHSGDALHAAVRVLIGHPDPQVRDWVRSHGGRGSIARRIAESHDLRGLLDQADVTDRLWDQAGALLYGMSRAHGYSVLHEYQDAIAVCRRWVELAHLRPATHDRAAALTALADEFATGHAALVLGDLRVELVATLKDVLTAWIEELGPVSAWIAQRAAALDTPRSGFAVRVVTHEPKPVGMAEARVVIDGVPIAARVFGCFEADPPECVIPQLAATAEPKEIVVDENDGAELRVTIVREGDEVVWRDWKCQIIGRLPQDVPFDAGEYDREVARFTHDHSWEWPARTVARLLNERLRADPTVLGRWDCVRGRCHATWDSQDVAELDFSYPDADPYVTFRLAVDVTGRDPEEVADEVFAALVASDPKVTTGMVGLDGRDRAALVGLPYRPYRRLTSR